MLKANASDVYTKTESDSKLNAKANASDVYTKTESDSKLNVKANASDVYTKTESDSKLNAKANVADVYSKTETDNKFALKADNSVVSAHTKRLDHLDNRVNKLDKDLKRGLAAQAALTGLFQPYTVGKANFTAAVGGYKSQTAVAIGTGYRYNQNIATKAGVAFTQGGGVTYNAGVNFEW
ncbi:putative yadA-like protein [Haemophilus haemolyticus M21127]|uniref:YadA C-terminal domain-containing protein n=1 Tax=Haemophilus haemolyticus TaxID=726 RepID=UPI00021B2755|nr:YadA C-terminal domain-containing protein [Haemophilus haemolyticus]EGT74027.1 putative yadA-like protein [Haemophilus haemolyticus M21127]